MGANPRKQDTGPFAFQVSGRVEYITPKWIIDALQPIDLDPCAAEIRPWSVAKTHYTKDGLELPWKGFVFLNPPYGRSSNEKKWVEKLSRHGNGIALLFSKTEISQWQDIIWPCASSILFMGTNKVGASGRISFCNNDGTSTGGHFGGSALVAFGPVASKRLAKSKIPGFIVQPAVKSG